jgi:hypothetical protein
MDKNTEWLIGWCDRMVAKYGHPMEGIDWCRKLAYFMEEEGNWRPSNQAVMTAISWEIKNPEEE